MADCKGKIDKELAFFENLNEESPESARGSCSKHINRHIDDITSITRNLNICRISVAPFNTLVRQVRKAKDIEIFSVLMRDMKIALQLKKSTNPATKLPAKFHDYLDVFSKVDWDLLSEHQLYDYFITLIK